MSRSSPPRASAGAQPPEATQPRIWLSSPHMGSREEEYVREAFATNWIAPLGPHVDGFERDLQSYTGVAHAAALSSGSAALHLGLILLGVEAGDTVLCQSFTFSATANPVAYLGATPVFIDSEPETWNMCPDALETALRASAASGHPLPKAIVPVHLYGMPAKMDEIRFVADRYGIPVLEDAAEALGSTCRGRACGGLGTLGVLSFNGNKIITTSGGGALLGEDPALIQKARFLATQARDPAPHYQHSHIGYNYRMSNVLAAIGRGQMEVLADRVDRRRANFAFYRHTLSDIPGIFFLPEPDGVFANRWLTAVTVDPSETGGIGREHIRLALEAENIESRPLWKPMHMQPVFARSPYYGGTVAESLFERGLCLPSGSNLSFAQLERVVRVIRRELRKD